MGSFNDSYYSDNYYGRNNGCLGLIVGGLLITGFIWLSDGRIWNTLLEWAGIGLVSLIGLGALVCGWRTVKGVASPFEVVVGVVCGGLSVVLSLAMGVGVFLLWCFCGFLLLVMFSTLGNQYINAGRYGRDTCDETFDVNERRAQRRQRR